MAMTDLQAGFFLAYQAVEHATGNSLPMDKVFDIVKQIAAGEFTTFDTPEEFLATIDHDWSESQRLVFRDWSENTRRAMRDFAKRFVESMPPEFLSGPDD